ncbi:hypothetical protein ABZ930_07860 [Streptomyces sp. NPDC046716]|uniref:hypothetical protein n=1 Tax=Streptomyces sp. NPDC046716 TaxID=3157093 RepID=UPI00340A90C4
MLADMIGFGGDRPWSSIATTLAPLLDHPDAEGEVTPAQCAAMLPRLEAIRDQPRPDGCNTHVHRRRVEDVSELLRVLRVCVNKNVELIFG